MHNTNYTFWLIIGAVVLIAFYPQLSKAMTADSSTPDSAGKNSDLASSGTGIVAKPGITYYGL